MQLDTLIYISYTQQAVGTDPLIHHLSTLRMWAVRLSSRSEDPQGKNGWTPDMVGYKFPGCNRWIAGLSVTTLQINTFQPDHTFTADKTQKHSVYPQFYQHSFIKIPYFMTLQSCM